jgi:hypothetical protein
MDRRPLGSTGLFVTRIGLGLAALGRPGYINLGRHDDLGDDRSIAIMERRCPRYATRRGFGTSMPRGRTGWPRRFSRRG